MGLKRLWVTVCAGLALAGCVTTQTPVPTSQTATANVPQRGLPAQDLAIGECGLFLWSVSGDPTFVFFSKASSRAATMLIGDAPQALSLIQANGDIFGQFTTEQSWRVNSSGQSIEVLLEPGEFLLDGQRVNGGRLNVIDAQGWETIIPVAGARACRSEPDPALAPSAQ